MMAYLKRKGLKFKIAQNNNNLYELKKGCKEMFNALISKNERVAQIWNMGKKGIPLLNKRIEPYL